MEKVTAGIPIVKCRFLGRCPPVLGLVALAGSARLTRVVTPLRCSLQPCAWVMGWNRHPAATAATDPSHWHGQVTTGHAAFKRQMTLHLDPQMWARAETVWPSKARHFHTWIARHLKNHPATVRGGRKIKKTVQSPPLCLRRERRLRRSPTVVAGSSMDHRCTGTKGKCLMYGVHQAAYPAISPKQP